LFQASVQGNYDEALKDRWGYLLMAVDSSHIALLRNTALWEYYGATGKEHLAALTGMRADFGERKVIAIFDRGYPSKDLIKHLQDKEITYVMRVRRGFNSRIDKMSRGSKIIKLTEDMGEKYFGLGTANGKS
jgi:hypothetical protein